MKKTISESSVIKLLNNSSNSKMISDLLFDVFNESSTALIIVTHDEDLADRCDQKIRLIDGKIQ